MILSSTCRLGGDSRRGASLLLVAMLLAAPAGTRAQAADALGQMSLEELMTVPVTTVTRSPELASRVAAALFVITADESAWDTTKCSGTTRIARF